MTLRHIITSRSFKIAALVIGALVVILASFAAGMKVGAHKALFSSQWGANYERNFLGDGGKRDGRLPEGKKLKLMEKGMRNAHGVAGEVLSVSGETLILKNRSNEENTVRANESTLVNRGKESIFFSDISVGDRVVVVGKPQDDGVVAAHLIRVLNSSQSNPSMP